MMQDRLRLYDRMDNRKGNVILVTWLPFLSEDAAATMLALCVNPCPLEFEGGQKSLSSIAKTPPHHRHTRVVS
jgi:hypothetical protein